MCFSEILLFIQNVHNSNSMQLKNSISSVSLRAETAALKET